jgi:hypothetical protein
MAWIADASSDVCQEDEAVLKVLGGSFRIHVADGDRVEPLSDCSETSSTLP